MVAACFFTAPLPAQIAPSQGATFGTSVSLGGEPSDIVLDEERGRLYLVSAGANRVIIYHYLEGQIGGHIGVGSAPLSAAMSPDGKFLYVTNVLGSSLSVVNLDIDYVVQTVSLPARPEGVAVGFDGRVLITTQGTGTNNTQNTLLLFDPSQEAFQQLSAVPTPPVLSTPNPLPAVTGGRPTTPFPGRLLRTPDGQFIIGMVAINQNVNQAQTTLFVYEAASGTVLRNRTVTGQSSVLSIAPDGARFMAGSTLYDTATLNVLGQVSTGNLPFLITAQPNNPVVTIQRNFGGSVFSPDGQNIYGAFNVQQNNATFRPLSNALLFLDSRHLGVRLGIRMPENILGKFVATTGGDRIFAISESGIVDIPLRDLYDAPMIQPESTQVFLAVDNCNKGIARASLKIDNIGGGRATFTVPSVTTALVTEVESGLAPATVNFVMEPGRTAVARQPGTNLHTGATLGTGIPIHVNIGSREAVNFPNVIRVYMNFRQPDQRGVIYPVPTAVTNTEGLYELLLDEPRGKVYITNSGFNRIEVFDIRRQRFVDPIEVGQLPHSMAMSLDRGTLYVGDTGGESITIVDLDARRATGRISFPPLAREGAQLSIRPLALGMAQSGLQFIMSNATNSAGTLWRLIGDEAVPRPGSNIISPNSATTQLPGPLQFSYASTPDGEALVALAGNGTVYLYNALADSFTSSRVIQQNPIQSYYGPAVGAPNGAYFLINGLILSPSLAVIGGAERPSATQVTPPTQPGQMPGQVTVSAGQRHIAAVYAMDETTFVRMTMPVRQNPTAATRDDSRPTIVMVDIRTGGESVAAVAPENPPIIATGTGRFATPARQMAVDSQGTAYVITVSGLSVIPLQRGGLLPRPFVTGGSRGILNANSGTPSFSPGSFVTVSGDSLANPAVAETVPLPTVMGGSCVTLNDVPLRLLQTSPEQITAQIPDDLRPGLYVAQVRSLANATQSDPVVITVQRPQ